MIESHSVHGIADDNFTFLSNENQNSKYNSAIANLANKYEKK